MLKSLSHLRDFLDDEALKFLPGNLLTGQFILLKAHHIDGKPVNDFVMNEFNKDKTYKTVIHVFDQGGTYIGTIEHPDWIPSVK